MRIIPILILACYISACSNNKPAASPPGKFYWIESRRGDTIEFNGFKATDTSLFEIVADVKFNDAVFSGQVIKSVVKNPPIDGEEEFYNTPDFGLVYSRSMSWGNYSRLHSTNDSIEKRLNSYIDHILSNPRLVKAGHLEIKITDQKD